MQYATFPNFARREEVRLPIPAGAKPRDFTVIDVMGNESPAKVEDGKLVLLLAREPVYVVCAGANAGAALAACYR